MRKYAEIGGKQHAEFGAHSVQGTKCMHWIAIRQLQPLNILQPTFKCNYWFHVCIS